MEFKELVKKARSYRRFDEAQPVSAELLADLVDTVRFVPCTTNSLTLRYAVCTEAAVCQQLSAAMGWAGLLKTWPGPRQGERPTGFIIIGCSGTPTRFTWADIGIAAQTIQLGLAREGLGCCMIANINPDVVRKLAGLPEEVTPLLAIPVGVPGEEVVLEDLAPGQPTAYWRDEEGVHHVPKKKLDDVLLVRR